MNLVPEWAPNFHPLLVHFPISLSFIAVLADGAALILRRRALRLGAAGLYGLAALGALAAFLTGRQAADSLEIPSHAVSTLTAHADLALYTVWALGLYALLRIGLAAWDRRNRLAIHLPVALLGIGSVVLVWQTAERGGELVFAHAIGVQQQALASLLDSPGGGPGQGAEPGTLRLNPQGGWTWHPAPGQALPHEFELLEGSRNDLQPSDAPADSLATFRVGNTPVLLVAGEPRQGVEVEAVVDLGAFEGTVALVHHVRGAEEYDFLAFDGSDIIQGRRAGDDRTIFGRETVGPSGAFRMRVTAHGTHFYGYVDGRSVVHGHGSAPEAGRAGIRLEGSGVVRIIRVAVTPTDDR